VSARYRTAVAPATWSVRACQCSFCRAHGGLTVSDPAGTLLFAAASNDKLHRYRFGTRTTDFVLCRDCGVYVGAVLVSAAGRFGVLNALALRPVPADLPAPAPMNYGEESVSEKRERREARWTPLAPESL
jgi:hypothetical protein